MEQVQRPPCDDQTGVPTRRSEKAGQRRAERALSSSLHRHIVVLGGKEQASMGCQKANHLRSPEQIQRDRCEPSFGMIPAVDRHGATGVVHEKRPRSGADLRQLLGSHPEPTMPILAGDQLHRLVETVPEKQIPLHIDARTRQWVSLSQGPNHGSSTDPRAIHDATGLIHDLEQLKEEPAGWIPGDEAGCPRQRACLEDIVGVEEYDIPSTGSLGPSIPRPRPFAVDVVDEHPKAQSIREGPGHICRSVGRGVIDHDDLQVIELLSDDRLQAPANEVRPVVGRHHQREERNRRIHPTKLVTGRQKIGTCRHDRDRSSVPLGSIGLSDSIGMNGMDACAIDHPRRRNPYGARPRSPTTFT